MNGSTEDANVDSVRLVADASAMGAGALAVVSPQESTDSTILPYGWWTRRLR